jgi:hypothetical protein
VNTKIRWLFTVFIIVGSALRVELFWITPPANAFDDHFEPIQLIMDTGRIPAKTACWECYQPPVFYWTSAMIGKSLVASGIATKSSLPKFLQFLNCLYGIATLGVVFLILRLLPLSDFAKLCGFGLLCFLPRHIYLSALHSNDTLSYLAIAVCVYLLVLILEKKHPSVWHLLLLSAMVSVTIFTKYTTFIILPTVFLAFVSIPWWHPVSFRNALAQGIAVLVIPVVLLGSYCMSNQKNYGRALPFNTAGYRALQVQPHDEKKYDFVTFKPWLFIDYPILRPGQLNSFWTLMYAGMWFDTEPKFIVYTGHDQWWAIYYGWLNGDNPFPDNAPAGARTSVIQVGSGLEAIGLVPLFLGLSGLWFLLKEVWRGSAGNRDFVLLLLMFLVLAVFDFAVAVQLAVNVPVFSAMKSSYILTALPAFCVFTGLGVQEWEKCRGGKLFCGTLLGALFLLVIIHVFQLAYYWTRF